MKKARVDIVTGHGYWFWWKLTASNGKIICHSETFPTRSNAVRAARRFLELAKNAEIVNE